MTEWRVAGNAAFREIARSLSSITYCACGFGCRRPGREPMSMMIRRCRRPDARHRDRSALPTAARRVHGGAKRAGQGGWRRRRARRRHPEADEAAGRGVGDQSGALEPRGRPSTRFIASAAALRDAHAAVLAGKRADLRAAGTAHEEALEADAQSGAGGAGDAGQPATDATKQAIATTLRALPGASERPGRLATLLQPRGFEMLAGMPARGSGVHRRRSRPRKPPPAPGGEAVAATTARTAERAKALAKAKEALAEAAEGREGRGADAATGGVRGGAQHPRRRARRARARRRARGARCGAAGRGRGRTGIHRRAPNARCRRAPRARSLRRAGARRACAPRRRRPRSRAPRRPKARASTRSRSSDRQARM